MNRCVKLLISLIIIGGLASCNLPVPPYSDSDNPLSAVPYETVSVLLTETAQVPDPSVSQTAMPSGGDGPLPKATAVAAKETAVAQPAESKTGEPDSQICNLAQPGKPFDLTIPDDTYLNPGEYFSKTWRLVNAGSCNWTENYSVVWFSGNDLGVKKEQPLGINVAPGESVDVTVDMVAPQTPGSYQSNWKLRDENNELFGIGPQGVSPFWARIVVLAPSDATPTPLPEMTPTPVIYAIGTFQLTPNTLVDLDTGQSDQDEGNDLEYFQSSDQQVYLTPLNGARVEIHRGEQSPDLRDCLMGNLSEEAINLNDLQPGMELCYRTNQGLPGRIEITSLEEDTARLNMDFVTWYVP